MDTTITPSPQDVPTLQYKDRRAGLIAFGILEILAGVICLLMVPMMLFGQAMSAKAASTETNIRLLLPAVFIYLVMAAVFIWLGVGSIQARRWARALSLVLGWSWLGMGAIMIIFYSIAFPRIFGAANTEGQTMSETTKVVALGVALVFMGFIFIVIPGAMVLFYGSKHVKATCEVRDAVTRWTDACPLPVIGVCVWLWFGAGVLLLMPAYNGVIAFFGTLLSGWPGALIYVLLAVVWLYSARALYQLKIAGWWVMVIAMVLFAVSNVITFARVDVTEMYRLMGYPEAQIVRMEQYSIFKGSGMMLWSVAWTLPLFGYLIYVRRFLVKPAHFSQSVSAA